MPPTIAREDLGLELRLAVAAHRAVGEDAPVVEGGERRDQRVEGLAPGLERVRGARVERERDAAVLPEDAGRAAARSPSRTPNRATGCRRRQARRGRSRPSRSCRPRRGASGKAAARRMSIVAASRSNTVGREEISTDRAAAGRDRCTTRSRMAKARFTASIRPWWCSTVSAAPDAEPLEDAEDEERGEPLGRRREVVQASRPRASPRAARPGGRGSVSRSPRVTGLPIALEIGGDLAPDVAAVEILEPGVGELRERVGERRQLAERAGRGRLAVDEEGLGEAGRGAQRLGLVRLAGALPTARPGSPRGRGGRRRARSAASGSRPPSVLA